MLTPSGSQPTGTPLGLKQEAGTLTPPEEDAVVLPVVAGSIGAAELLNVGLAELPPSSTVDTGVADELVVGTDREYDL